MIVVVTPNPAVDVTYRVDEQRVGRTQRVLDVARRPGGKGVNVARVLHAAGVPSRCVLPLGGAPGAWLAAALDVPATTVALSGETRTTVTVVDDVAHPTMFGEPGPRVTAAEWDALVAAVAADAADADALVVSGSLPRDADPAGVGRLIGAATGLTVADVSGPALLAAADAGADVCKPNREELLAATGAAGEADGAADLLARGAGTVVVSRGVDGLAAHTRDAVLTVPAVPGVRGNATGAGDAATAGLVLALTRGLTLRAALGCAAAFGAAAVLRPTAGEVDHRALTGFLTDLPLELPLDPTRSPA
ncbi:1-phosphofructokinase family hexose kinase [Kineococcus sp. SYSU DK001]|uniref:1-phosphofructokinase family hexose kinase n=1 Tax=Kineococcus sp. SYSU DK001 TaxID=3383122 RepID=UPI003D7DDDA4